MAELTHDFIIHQERETLNYWQDKAVKAEKMDSAVSSEAAEHRQEAIYARNCVGFQRLKIIQLEKERDEQNSNDI